ncbi:flavin reductase family protein [Actinoplanes sp. LDG1-06]|uniref:Flavin reductase family protein n=1 Tax=Paractinoplanes ovalisporus TaxID=2810368 RepID=A0ABS2AI39_9ACTN|nr:flavin reductase family protein [Actinoplanes ovalisporus]MBM2619509.1 flavin reductase family protein [Actinoplanes ovalisporus]
MQLPHAISGTAATLAQRAGAEPDPDSFRAAMGLFPTGVALLSTGTGDDLEVMTINSLTSISLDPLLVMVSVRTGARMQPLLAERGTFAVSVLSAEQEQLCRLFARRDRPRGHDAAVLLGCERPGADPVARGALTALRCRTYAEHPAGDHVLHIGLVTTIVPGPAGAPLLSHRGTVGPGPH